MSDTTTLACWPACVNAIDWSHDGVLAVASEEQVELLIPHSQSHHQTQTHQQTHQQQPQNQEPTSSSSPSWQHVPLPASWFTPEELPDKPTAAMSTFSTGEEISISAPVAIAWSPPGLAQHRRCALGVLTSSLVMGVWASEGVVGEAESWGRRVIVNDALEVYFEAKMKEEEEDGRSGLSSDPEETMRLRTRVRCFAWAPLLAGPHGEAVLGTQAAWGRPVVAVSNDDNHVALVVVGSPATTLGAEENWSGEVVGHFGVGTDEVVNPGTFEEIMGQQRHVSQLAWSPWVTEGESQYSVLVYATNEDVRARVVTYTEGAFSIAEEETIYPDVAPRYSSLLKWSAKVSPENTVTLALLGSPKVTVLTISARTASILTRLDTNHTTRWDEISGAIWDHTTPIPTLHLASLQESLKYPSTLHVSPSALTPAPTPRWRAHLADTQSLFSAQHDLKGNAKIKVWGLATSPLGDFVATCTTIHPTDMIEYGPPNERRTSVTISRLRAAGASENALDFPIQTHSAEGIAFSLRRWIDAGDGTALPLSTLSSLSTQLFASHWKPHSPPPPLSQLLPSEVLKEKDLPALITLLKHALVLNEQSIKDRCDVLIQMLCAPEVSTLLPRTLIAYRVARGMMSLPREMLWEGEFGREVRRHHAGVVGLVEGVVANGSTASDTDNVDGAANGTTSGADGADTNGADTNGANGTTTNGTNSVNGFSHGSSADAAPDTCDFCTSPIPIYDLDTAICTKGHEFPRCGLSFIAIQRPGVSTSCGVCGRAYLRGEFVREQEREEKNREEKGERGEGEGTVEEGEGKSTLGSVLFGVGDVCVYCGGKFSG